MKIEAKIINYTVLKDGISVQMNCTGKDSEMPEKFLSIKDRTGYFTIGNIGTAGSVKSVNIRKGVHLLLHLPRTTYIAKNLFSLMDSDMVPVTINSDQEKRLLCLLNKASAITDKSQQKLLLELTSFTGKKGKLVEGKESIYDLSPRFQEVVISKLLRILKTTEGNHAKDNRELVQGKP